MTEEIASTASKRSRNNAASKKCYEKSQEQLFATDYEHAVVEHHRKRPHVLAVWHWSDVPEDHLYDAGYIHDFSKHRQLRLMRKQEAEAGKNRLRDYGLDGLAMVRGQGDNSDNTHFDSLQAKYYHSRKVTGADIGTFLVKQTSMWVHNQASKGWLYTTTKLEANLADEVKNPAYPIQHIRFDWKHPDGRGKWLQTVPDMEEVLECDLPLRDYQKEVLQRLESLEQLDETNDDNDQEDIDEEDQDASRLISLCIPCRMGKTLIAGHTIRRVHPTTVIAIAPLKISVENLRNRLACFLPDHKPLLVDSDSGGTTDEKEIETFVQDSTVTKRVIYSTYDSAVGVLSGMIRGWFEDGTVDPSDTFLLVDEVHNACGQEMIQFIQMFSMGMIMSATMPEELLDTLNIPEERRISIPFSRGIEGGWLVDYTVWLPHLLQRDDGTSEVSVTVPQEFAELPADLTSKALYHAVCMLRTGSRRCITYLASREECDQYMTVVRRVFEDYHGLEVWTGKIDSSVGMADRKAILTQFSEGSNDIFRVLTSVRILDEAVDIPACDSVFITAVGEHSSDIRFFQRAQRSSTLDPKRPEKRNNIFLWAEGWEKCVGALQLLRDADPTFHKKLRVADSDYDADMSVARTEAERRETVAKQTEDVRKWYEVKCVTVEERMMEKVALTLKYAEEHGRVPPSKTVVSLNDGRVAKIGVFWNNMKQGRNRELYLQHFQPIPLFREDYERLQAVKEEKKKLPPLTSQETAHELLRYVHANQQLPAQSITVTTADGQVASIGSFWDDVKQGKVHRELYLQHFQPIPLFREEYERLQAVKEEKKKIPPLTSEETAHELLRYVEAYQQLPAQSITVTTADGRIAKIGSFWTTMKQGCNRELYLHFQPIPLFREEYERLQAVKEEKKKIPPLTSEETAHELLRYVEAYQQLPAQSITVTTADGRIAKIGSFWTTMKQGCNRELYLHFQPIPLFREDYDKLQALKEEKKKIPPLSSEETAHELLRYAHTNQRLPTALTTVTTADGRLASIGRFWDNIKQGKNRELYLQHFQPIPLFREDFERVQAVKARKADKKDQKQEKKRKSSS